MKKLLLIRGLPGSGKTTKANALVADLRQHSLWVCSIRTTDDYFMVNGKYLFDRRKLGLNHRANQKVVESDMMSGVNMIIVPNTNIRRKDMQPYIAAAMRHGYEVEELIVGNFDKESIKLYHARGLHNVPLETIERMAEEFEK